MSTFAAYDHQLASEEAGPNSSSGSDAVSKCEPCSSLNRDSLLSTSQVEEDLRYSLPLWTLQKIEENTDGDQNDATKDDTNTRTTTTTSVLKIRRAFMARSFTAALDVLNAIGVVAEREGHHPDLHLTSYRSVEIVIYTHSVGGVTRNDITLAQLIDAEVKIDYSPKWLNDHPEAAFTSLSSS